VADAAFLLLVVTLRLGRMAGAAETARRRKLRDSRGRVACVAALVRGFQCPMRKLRLGNCVTRRAVAANGVVFAVAILALSLRRRNRARDWSVMARQTSALLVHRVEKIYRARTRLMARHLHRHRRVLRGRILVRLVAG